LRDLSGYAVCAAVKQKGGFSTIHSQIAVKAQELFKRIKLTAINSPLRQKPACSNTAARLYGQSLAARIYIFKFICSSPCYFQVRGYISTHYFGQGADNLISGRQRQKTGPTFRESGRRAAGFV
jgi:hypothetical protein